jgi:hypothetical protein
MPVYLSNSIRYTELPVTLSDGFNMKVLPHVIASGNIHKGIITGKLKGVIPAVIPSGSLKETISISLDTFYNDSP